MEARVYDFANTYIGTVSRAERMLVPAKGTAMMRATGVFPTSLELGALCGCVSCAADCEDQFVSQRPKQCQLTRPQQSPKRNRA
jgi:hypothetical protein